jgi:hypothetical protein
VERGGARIVDYKVVGSWDGDVAVEWVVGLSVKVWERLWLGLDAASHPYSRLSRLIECRRRRSETHSFHIVLCCVSPWLPVLSN